MYISLYIRCPVLKAQEFICLIWDYAHYGELSQDIIDISDIYLFQIWTHDSSNPCFALYQLNNRIFNRYSEVSVFFFQCQCVMTAHYLLQLTTELEQDKNYTWLFVLLFTISVVKWVFYEIPFVQPDIPDKIAPTSYPLWAGYAIS